MAVRRIFTGLAEKPMKTPDAKSRARAMNLIIRDSVALKRFKSLMKKNAGKLKFAGSDK